jgi:EPS-associated MarR family transcriptional regulator
MILNQIQNMNRMNASEIHYRLLRILNEAPDIQQRALAARMGVSLGKVNYCLAELTAKGWIKVKRLNAMSKKAYLYQLTPQGLEAKALMTIRFLKVKLAEYHEIQSQIKMLYREAARDGLVDDLPELTAAVAMLP